MKTANVEVATQTPVGVKIGILVMMGAALTMAAGILAGPRAPKSEPVIPKEEPVVAATAEVVEFNSPFAANQVIVKFKPAADQATVISNVLTKSHTVTIDKATQDVIQKYQSKEFRIEDTSIDTDTSPLETTTSTGSTSTEDFLAVEYAERIAIETEVKEISLSLQDSKQLFGEEADTEKVKKNFSTRTSRISPEATLPANQEGWQIITIDQQADISVLVDEFNALAEVEFAQPNYIYQSAVTPDDYFYNTSPPEKNIPPKEDMWGLKEISLEKSWGLMYGRGDVDEDGDIDADDYNLLICMITSSCTLPDPATIADVNNTNTIDTADIVYLNRIINEDPPPPLFNYSDNEVIVAVLDTGVDYNHEDLADNIWVAPTAFGAIGSRGVVTSDSTSSTAYDIANDASFMYIVGFGGGWRIEKRSLFDGALDLNFDSDGIVTTGGNYWARSISTDSNYMYVAGYYNNDQNWRIEKRRLSDGSLCTDAALCGGVGFGYDCSSGTCNYTGDGVILGENTTHYLSDIAIDESYMYLTGHDGTDANANWRIEKRLLSNGQLCTAGACSPDPDFGDGGSGVIIGEERSPGAGLPRIAIAIDDTHMYLAGDHVSQDWRIERRLLSDGTLDNIFGSGGVVAGSSGSHVAREIAFDGSNIYVVGFEDGNNPNMRIEKYLQSDGTPDTSFGTGGVVVGGNTNIATPRGTTLAIDNNNIYIAFENNNNIWRYETYKKSDGLFDPNFGTGGVIITGSSDSLTPWGMVIDDSYMYVVGDDIGPDHDWRIEKRQLTTGALGNAGDVHGWDFVDCDDLTRGVCNTSRPPDNDPMDDRGHGTHVAGTIAAQYTNSSGVASVCPHCTIMPVKALNVQGKGLSGWLADSIIYATDNGADVINMSWYGYFSDALVTDALDYAHSLGVVLVASAGNDAVDVTRFGGVLPANHANVISVGALNKEPGGDWVRDSISNWGRKIDASAPGKDILSTVPTNVALHYGDASGYRLISGTSMASPHVAGLAGLLLAYDPTLTNTMVKGRIMSNTDDIPTPLYKAVKHGVINPYRTLTAADKSHALYLNHVIDDSSGNNDGKIDPGETVDIIMTLKNYGTSVATNVSVNLSVNDSTCINFINTVSTYSTISHNQTQDNNSNPFQLEYLSTDGGVPCTFRNIKFNFTIVSDDSSDNGQFVGVYPYDVPVLANWPLAVGAVGSTDSWSTPLLVNLDADADLEIIVTIKDKIFAFNPDGTTVAGSWPLTVNGFTSAAMPITGNFDGDPEPEIVFGTMIWTGANPDENKLYVVNHDGTAVSGWPVSLPGDISHAAAVADIDNDGFEDIVVGIGSTDGATNKVMAFDKGGNILAGWDKTLEGNTFNSDKSPVIADLDNDGKPEVILAGNGKVYVWNGDGTNYGTCWPHEISPLADNNVLTASAVANIDADANLEIVFGSTNGLMYAMNDDCSIVSGWPVNYPSLGPETPVIGDLDADGDMEIVMPAPDNNEIYAWNHDGTLLAGWPVTAFHVMKVSLADLDGNSNLEVVAGTNLYLTNIINDAFLEAWSYEGIAVAGFPIVGIYNTGVTQPAIADINGDGTLEIVTGEYLPDADNEVHIFDLPHTGNIEWPTFQNTTGLEGSYFNRCSDGTIYGQCNASQQYCSEGTLSNNCRQCGYICPTNYTCTLSGACSYNSGGGGGSCFLPGTPIQLSNGQSKPIEDIQVGDIVVAYDEDTNSFKEAAILNFFEHEADNYLIINDNLKVTPNHEVYSDGVWVEIGLLNVGDSLVDDQGNPLTINSISIVDEKVTVYNLEVDTYHTYVAGGIVVHNKSQQIPKKGR